MKAAFNSLALTSLMLTSAANAEAAGLECSGTSMYRQDKVTLSIASTGEAQLNYGEISTTIGCEANHFEGQATDLTTLWTCKSSSDDLAFNVDVRVYGAWVSGNADGAFLTCGQ